MWAIRGRLQNGTNQTIGKNLPKIVLYQSKTIDKQIRHGYYFCKNDSDFHLTVLTNVSIRPYTSKTYSLIKDLISIHFFRSLKIGGMDFAKALCHMFQFQNMNKKHAETFHHNGCRVSFKVRLSHLRFHKRRPESLGRPVISSMVYT